MLFRVHFQAASPSALFDPHVPPTRDHWNLLETLLMTQYQSFPGVKGASESLAKLRALRLPSLQGKRFLDVGCNEGFFCGYARFDGAVRGGRH
jgi:hypothetical protein